MIEGKNLQLTHTSFLHREKSGDLTQADDGDEAAVVSLAIEAVQQSTERLASEQARYQIQFRQDLAELAERLRRPAR